MLRQRQWIAWVAALRLAAASPVAAEAPMNIGVLTCAVAETARPGAPTEGVIEPQARDILCWFRPFSEGPEETYAGTAMALGRVRDLFARRVIAWVVRGTPTTRASSGLLQQVYAADPKAGPGYQPALIGETRSELVLEPFADKEPQVQGKEVQPLYGIITSVALTLKSSPG